MNAAILTSATATRERVDADDASDVRAALRRLGVKAGGVLFVHTELAALGQPMLPPEQRAAALLAALEDVLGPEGTLLVPTYTFSFCRGEPFDPARTPTRGGPWSPSVEFLEHFRRQPGVIRSADPIHSVAGRGPRARALLAELPPTCFGSGSLFARLIDEGAQIALIGLPLDEATVRHHTEERIGVPFRFRKLFTGDVCHDGSERRRGWVYSVRLLAANATPDGARLDAMARAAGVCRSAPLAAGELLVVDARVYDAFVADALTADPWLTARGPAGDPVVLEAARVGGGIAPPVLPVHAGMDEMIEALWRLPRDIVSDGYDAALAALATQIPMAVHAYPTGTECWSWLVPEKWTCHEARLETLDGRVLLDQASCPLHVVSYSLPYEGELSRAELLAHLHVHPQLPDAVPFVFKYYERDWGLCCSRTLRDSLDEDRYRVVIRTSFSYGTLKVGEVVVPGREDGWVVLCAHLCHPAMVNDDLSGVVVGLEVMRRLRLRAQGGAGGRHGYRLLILPETIGSIAWLSHNEALIPHLRAGLFLEMLGLDNPFALQRSFAGDTDADACFTAALQAADPRSWTGAFRSIIGNDERQFNAPGVRVPMLSLSRVLPPTDPAWPYPEYHSSADVPALAPLPRLEEAVDAVLRMLDTLERNVVPVNRYKGELFCSRFGIHVDAYTNPEGNRALFDLLFLIDGTRTVMQIADACGISFDAAWQAIEELRRRDMVYW